MATHAYYLGIDLGTTNTAAVAFDGETSHVVRTADGAFYRPSVVRIDAKGRVHVGADARRAMESDPRHTLSEFKRLMGSGHTFTVPGHAQAYRPQDLSSIILKSVRDDFANQFGQVPARAVVSVPALFELPQIAATAEAARLAGFESVEIIQEPIASAIAAGWTATASTRPWLVFDLGGGTFDASLLETREGTLRIIGHDGDNFLGGRDIDVNLLTAVLGKVADQGGPVVDTTNPQNTEGLRALRFACENAKIQLSRADEAYVTSENVFSIDGVAVDVDVVLTRGDVEAATAPVIGRCIDVCQRLLKQHGMVPDDIERLVLVGGPTAMPLVRRTLQHELGVAIADGIDPMTAVATGAAVFAMNAGLSADAPETTEEGPVANEVWLQFPAVTADSEPFVVGRVLASDISRVRVRRNDGGFLSREFELSAENAFAAQISLKERHRSAFTVEGLRGEAWVELAGGGFAIAHGLSVGDPPLARSIGVATSEDRVRVFFERGTPLPLRRVFRLETVEAIRPSIEGSSLRVPIVQGEYPLAHLCRLIGTLEISASRLSEPVPPGTPIDFSLELDRSGQLVATAHIVTTGASYAEVIHLGALSRDIATLEHELEEIQSELAMLQRDAFRSHDSPGLGVLGRVDMRLVEVRSDLDSAKGGDADAHERAHRALLDVRGELEELGHEERLRTLVASVKRKILNTSLVVSSHGTEREQAMFEECCRAFDEAVEAQDTKEIKDLISQFDTLWSAAASRSEEIWRNYIEYLGLRIDECFDPPRALELISASRSTNEPSELMRVVRRLEALFPADTANRARAFHSSVR